ncbi:stage III sporulation protein AG [Alloiococcus sp. CFN-8]|uniref:stage III sporulation protein AG n=1 Tax=Alloiococcus sp. CFN-8 TaxID=3416081 RepID=UPI003CEFB5CD
MDTKKLLAFLKLDKNKPNWNYLILILILVLTYIVIDNIGGDTGAPAATALKEEVNSSISSSSYEEQQKNELQSILSKMKGVGEVEVMIYFESGEEQIPATENNNSNTYTEETDNQGGKRTNNQSSDGTSVVMQNQGNGTSPFILKVNKPRITGVVVIAEGAEDTLIKYDIENAISRLYDLNLDKVYVYPMKK